ncbi:hypothetical protein BKD30_10345 [Tersicoccus phoenicis]|uniref:DUF1048 domain-containing protein n=1 Tax=Tersicoccus phoenicis TaxID=554083 RepID=A0A1R1L8C9_9MICC|nr:DUF1048 domain-containing protein [Tersicoccus phoenicis]OMH23782.1 hypothetical protein BKD30_10345 [Tersicoccus phoenicis]
MAARWIESLTGSLEQKKQYKQDAARIEGLPEPHRGAAKAVHRYLMYCGGMLDGDAMVRMFGDLADLWEQAVADGSTVHDVVGADPVDFAETFAQSYAGRQWIDKERARLIEAVDRAERGEPAS